MDDRRFDTLVLFYINSLIWQPEERAAVSELLSHVCYRRLLALVRFQDRILVSRKTVYRVLKQQGWFVHMSVVTVSCSP